MNDQNIAVIVAEFQSNASHSSTLVKPPPEIQPEHSHRFCYTYVQKISDESVAYHLQLKVENVPSYATASNIMQPPEIRVSGLELQINASSFNPVPDPGNSLLINVPVVLLMPPGYDPLTNAWIPAIRIPATLPYVRCLSGRLYMLFSKLEYISITVKRTTSYKTLTIKTPYNVHLSVIPSEGELPVHDVRQTPISISLNAGGTHIQPIMQFPQADSGSNLQTVLSECSIKERESSIPREIRVCSQHESSTIGHSQREYKFGNNYITPVTHTNTYFPQSNRVDYKLGVIPKQRAPSKINTENTATEFGAQSLENNQRPRLNLREFVHFIQTVSRGSNNKPPFKDSTGAKDH